MVATIRVNSTTGSNFATFAAAVLANIQSVTPNGFPTATAITILGANGDSLRVAGSISISGAGAVTGGTVTELIMRDNGAAYVSITGFSVDALTFYTTVTGPNPADVLGLIGDVRFLGNDGIDFGAGAGGNDDLRGGLADDTLEANGGDDVVDGGDGGDTMAGGAGADTLTYERSTLGVTVNLATGGAAGGDATGDNFIGFENLRGSDKDDKLSGNGGANQIAGLGGNDALRGAGGADTLDGGSGIDSADYKGSTAGVTIDLVLGTAAGGHAAGDSLDSIESLLGSSHADVFKGGTADNQFLGQGGDDSLSGGAGNDRLSGGADGDRLDGGNGRDRLSGGSDDDTFVLHKFGSNYDRILDFASGIDKLEVSAAEFGGGLDAVLDLDADQFETNATGLATGNEDRFILDTSTGKLWFDGNGLIGGAVGARVVANFGVPTPPLAASDFEIV